MPNSKEIGQHFINILDDWLRNRVRCSFASSFLSDIERIAIIPHYLEDNIDTLNTIIEGWGEALVAGAIVFPDINSELDLCNLIKRLHGNRWKYKVTHRGEYPNIQGTLVSLTWETKDKTPSQTMGFAPLYTMPFTRRTPFVAVALWPGTAKKSGSESVSFMDMPSYPPYSNEIPEGGKSPHQKALGQTKMNVSQLLGKTSTEAEEKPEAYLKKAPWRYHAFCLGEEARGNLLPERKVWR